MRLSALHVTGCLMTHYPGAPDIKISSWQPEGCPCWRTPLFAWVSLMFRESWQVWFRCRLNLPEIQWPQHAQLQSPPVCFCADFVMSPFCNQVEGLLGIQSQSSLSLSCTDLYDQCCWKEEAKWSVLTLLLQRKCCILKSGVNLSTS